MPPKKKTTIVTPATTSFAPAAKTAAAPVPVSRSETKGSGTATAVRPLIKETARVLTHQQIAERAYQLYLKRGFGPGNAHADWIEAERQLKAGL